MFWLPYKYEFKVANINLHDYDFYKKRSDYKNFFFHIIYEKSYWLLTVIVCSESNPTTTLAPCEVLKTPANIQLSNMNYFSIVNAHFIHQTLREDPMYVSWQVVIYIYYYYLSNHTWPLSDKYYFQ